MIICAHMGLINTLFLELILPTGLMGHSAKQLRRDLFYRRQPLDSPAGIELIDTNVGGRFKRLSPEAK